MLGKLWSALPLEEKEKYERKVEKQRVDQGQQRIDNGRQELPDVIKSHQSKNDKSDGNKSGGWKNKVTQLSEVPDPFLIFSSEVRGEVVKRNPTLPPEKVSKKILAHKILLLEIQRCQRKRFLRFFSPSQSSSSGTERWKLFWKRCGG